MMKKGERLMSMVLVLAMVLSGSINCFAADTGVNISQTVPVNEISSVTVTDDGVHINGTFYTQEEFPNLLENATEVPTCTSRAVGAAVIAGTWFIPGIGQVVVTAAGVVIIGGTVIAAGSWLYKQVTNWFAEQQTIKAIKAKIPNRLKDSKGNVDLGKFNQKVNNKNAYKEKGDGLSIKILLVIKGASGNLKISKISGQHL